MIPKRSDVIRKPFMNAKPVSRCCDPRSVAVALGRWAMGMLFLFSGLGKLNSIGGFVEGLLKQFKKTWLTPALVKPFGYALPFAEVILGLMLILGIYRNVSLFATAVVLGLLAFGQLVAGNPQVVFSNTVYVFLTAALLFLEDYDRWVLFPARRPPGE